MYRLPRNLKSTSMIEFFQHYWPYLLVGLDVILALMVTFHAVLYKQETDTIISWVGLAWLAPFIGVLAYFCFGINRIQRKAVSLEIGQGILLDSPAFEEGDYQLRAEFLERFPNLMGLVNLGNNVTEKKLLPGNKVVLLRDGDEAFPAMLEAIDSAEQSVALLSYIFDSDRVGEQFLQSLKSACARGVEVRVLIDALGSNYSKPNMVRRLKSQGIRAAAFLPTRTARLFRYANLRNHRKILVVDGKVGFTGGTNIREGHALLLKPEMPVQCAHFQLQGPVVADLQKAFAVDWAFACGEMLLGDLWFPVIQRSDGNVGARGVTDGPDEYLNQILEVILGALATASKHVRIATPYFIPDRTILRSLIVAAHRGVIVDIVLPSDNNVPIVDWASAALIAQLIEKGCRVHRSAPPFDHTKLMTIDGVWSLIGSTNWDARSLRLNFEFNVECYSMPLAQELEELIDAKISKGRRLTLEEIEKRSLPVKLRDGLARLASPYL